jgi:hypothetical protein
MRIRAEWQRCHVFEETVFGGAVPKTISPAVEKGFIESTEHGLLSRLSGHPALKPFALDGIVSPCRF